MDNIEKTRALLEQQKLLKLLTGKSGPVRPDLIKLVYDDDEREHLYRRLGW